jgi:hypothetical protein
MKLLRCRVGDFDTELVFQRHDRLDHVDAGDAQLVHPCGLGNLVGVDLEFRGHDAADPFRHCVHSFPPARKGNAVTRPADPYLVLRGLRGNLKPSNTPERPLTSPFARAFTPTLGYFAS